MRISVVHNSITTVIEKYHMTNKILIKDDFGIHCRKQSWSASRYCRDLNSERKSTQIATVPAR
jgi:hypothetical protein